MTTTNVSNDLISFTNKSLLSSNETARITPLLNHINALYETNQQLKEDLYILETESKNNERDLQQLNSETTSYLQSIQSNGLTERINALNKKNLDDEKEISILNKKVQNQAVTLANIKGKKDAVKQASVKPTAAPAKKRPLLSKIFHGLF